MLSCVYAFGYAIFSVAFDNNKITVDNGELFDYYSLIGSSVMQGGDRQQ